MRKLKFRRWNSYSKREKRGLYYIAAMVAVVVFAVVGGYYP